MKKNEKTQKPMGFFNVGYFEKKKNIGSNQIGPNEAHPVRYGESEASPTIKMDKHHHLKNSLPTHPIQT